MSKWMCDPLNIITDSLYVAGVVTRIEQADIKDLRNQRLMELLLQLQRVIKQRTCAYAVVHIHSHQGILVSEKVMLEPTDS